MACAMARKRRFRFGLAIVFAGRPSVGGVDLGQFGSLRRPVSARSTVYCLTASCRIQKARSGFSDAGLRYGDSALNSNERTDAIPPLIKCTVTVTRNLP